MQKVYIDVVGLRNWTPVHGPGAGAIVYAIAGLCDAQGRWTAKRRNGTTNQVKVDKEVRFLSPTMVFEYDGAATLRIVCLERRFRKRELGHVVLDLEHYTSTDRVDRWFKLVEEDGEKKEQKKGEVRVRVRFTAEPWSEEKDVQELPAKKQRSEDLPLSFERSLQVTHSAAENFEHGEPQAWVQVELQRRPGEKRKGVVTVRVTALSSRDELASLSVVCGEQMALSQVGECYSFPVVYEPESNFVKLFVFLHALSEAPVASGTVVFEDDNFLSEWHPLYARGHPQFVRLASSHLRSLRLAPAPAAPPEGLLLLTRSASALGAAFFASPPKERLADQDEQHTGGSRQTLVLVAATLFGAALLVANFG